MEFLRLEGRWLRAAATGIAFVVAVGLVAAGFQLSVGGDEAMQRVVDEMKEEERPPSRWAGPLQLPTDNVALFKENGGAAFFQSTDRLFEGRRTHPWQAGQYGFVRSPVRTSKGIVYSRFHEGIDIQATRRDERGEPLDTVRTVDQGTVAYVNRAAAASNYGRYVVVEHEWEGAPYYALYAHLSDVMTETGAAVQQGAVLGRMGYTGAGINRRRAHVHLELNVLINDHFQRWINKYFGGNPHGVYSGLNMRGWDPAAYFKALREEPDLKLRAFLRRQEPYYKIAFPRTGPLDLLRRYPWMRPDEGEATRQATAWEMSFTRGGFPLKVEPAEEDVSAPTVTMDPPVEGVACTHLTYGHLRGTPPGCTLAPRGERYIDLITMQGENETSERAW